MSVAIDNSSSSAIKEDVSSITFTSHTIAGADRCLVVCVTWVNPAFETNVSGVTYGGVAMTSAGAAVSIDDGFSFSKSQIWRLINPADGPGDVVATFSDVGNYGNTGAMSFTGVHQTIPLGTLATATGTSTGPSVAVSAATGDMVIDAMSSYGGATATAGASQTGFFSAVSASLHRGAGSTEAGDTSVTMSWTLGSSQRWAISAIPVLAATPAGTQNAIAWFTA